MIERPFVSVIIPCRNEERFIGICLDSVLQGDYPIENMEILVVDGMSEDRTREIVQEYGNRISSIRLLDNPDRITASALNIAVRHSTGQLIIRLDSHAQYAPDYISKSVDVMKETSADIVGGVRNIRPRTDGIIGKVLAASLETLFAAGRPGGITGKTREVDTVFCGCYRREIFDRVGLFDERMVRAQDRELSRRVLQSGGRILQARDIQCTYFARSDLKSYFEHIFLSGVWPVFGSRITGRSLVSWRNFAPSILLIVLVSLLLLGAFFPVAWVVVAIMGVAYSVVALYYSRATILRERDIRVLIAILFVFGFTHIIYGAGCLYGIFKRKGLRRVNRA